MRLRTSAPLALAFSGLLQSSFWLVYVRYSVAVCAAGIPPTPPFIIDFLRFTVYPMNQIPFALPYLTLNILAASLAHLAVWSIPVLAMIHSVRCLLSYLSKRQQFQQWRPASPSPGGTAPSRAGGFRSG